MEIHIYYDIDSPLMNNPGEKEEGGAFLLALVGETPDSGFPVVMRPGSVEQATIAQLPDTMVLE